ncbi:MAG: NAD(P)H-dependent oxidoreductase [Brevundimonas sp.]|uniref:NAD(P)H-dependent oxidoreductase n=1 Tax=Brevundimonas sp. TaxID=1871086 RepID=UPI00391B467A
MDTHRKPPRRILIIEGHPDPSPQRLCHGLAEAYREGAREAGHTLRTLILGDLGIPPLGSRSDWEALPPEIVQACQQDLLWAQHVVVFYPLWLGDVPAVLKAFLEQVLRPGFAFDPRRKSSGGLLKGRSARLVVTMGMPGWFYIGWFGAHSLRMLRRNVFRFVGFRPVRTTVLGMVEGASLARRRAWLDEMTRLGRLGL